MKQLPETKTYSGDGYAGNPVLLTQVTRTPSVAMYARASQDAPGLIYGYEVFHVKVVEAGTPLPGGKTVERTKP